MQSHDVLIISESGQLHGTVPIAGAKNAVLVTMGSLLLTRGVSKLYNVPASDDVFTMIELLCDSGAEINFIQDQGILIVDTTSVYRWVVRPDIMRKMRASILVLGPLLARFGRADIALPGGCSLGARPIDLHLKGLVKMGAEYDITGSTLTARAKELHGARIVLDYPSVGATENILMAAVGARGITKIINAALEPEVLDLIDVLRKMGAQIIIESPASIIITGVDNLQPIEHEILFDRLEVGSLLLAVAVTGGTIELPHVRADILDVFLEKLSEMGHQVIIGPEQRGISFTAAQYPHAVDIITGPYPQFPTDLQAPFMVAQCRAEGVSEVYETVYENRMGHVPELIKMGADITVNGDRAQIVGPALLTGTTVVASDIRASCALAIAGLVARGSTVMEGIHHWRRGYMRLEEKLAQLGGSIHVGRLEATGEFSKLFSNLSLS